MSYIEREAVNALIKAECSPKVAAYLIDAVATIPAADVRPVVRAKIVDMRYAEDDGEWKCTHCWRQYTLCVCGKDVTSKIRFCPNCGADMRPTSMSGANGEES